MKRREKFWMMGMGCAVLLTVGWMWAAWAQQAPAPATTDPPNPPSDHAGPAGSPPLPPAWHGTGAGRGAGCCPPGCPGFADADGDGRCDNFRDENGDGWCDNRPAGPPRGFRGQGYGGPGGRGRP